MHSRKKGKSGSSKPELGVPKWVTHTKKEVDAVVLKLAKEGKTAATIGSMLRDSYGIPDVKEVTGKSVTGILKENNLQPEVPEDLMALIKKNIQIRNHLQLNKHDEPAKRGLILTESKMRRLIKYYKKQQVLPADWAYNPEKLRLLVG